MNPRTGKVRLPWKVRLIALLIAVIARAHKQKFTAVFLLGAVDVNGHMPLIKVAFPVSGDDLVIKANFFSDSILVGGLIDVIKNCRTVGDGLFCFPGFEVVAKSMHIAVGADTGITENVPSASNGLPALQQSKAMSGAIPL